MTATSPVSPIPDPSFRGSFPRLLLLMGGSSGLLMVLTATAIWGFQPYFLSRRILALLDTNEQLFLLIRYGFASVFLALLFASTTFCLRRGSAVVLVQRKSSLSWWTMAAIMGSCLYIARVAEVLSYGPRRETAAFGMIFSIFFVLLWDFKRWVIHRAGTALTLTRYSRLGQALRELSLPMQSPVDVLSWFVQATLVVTAGLFFVYAQDGRLPSGSAFAPSIGWALLSSFALSLFYDLAVIAPIPGKSLAGNAHGILRAQLMVSLFGLLFALSHWTFTSEGLASEFRMAVATMQTWSAGDLLRYFVGYIAGVTCLGYVVESAGLVLHDSGHRFGEWRIAAREWASIAATLDPMVSVLFVVPLFALPTRSAQRFWFWVAGVSICAVAAQSFLRLWLTKSEQLRGRALGAVYAADARQQPDSRQVLRWLSRLMLFRGKVSSTFSLTVPLAGAPDGDRIWQLVLRRSHQFSHQGVLHVKFFAIGDGKLLFDTEDFEGGELWRRYVAHLVGDSDSELVLAEELHALLAGDRAIYAPGSDPFQLRSLSSQLGTLVGASEGTLVGAHISGSGCNSIHGQLKASVQRLVWICKGGGEEASSQAESRSHLLSMVLPPGHSRQDRALLSSVAPEVPEYVVDVSDIVVSDSLPSSLACGPEAVVLVQAELVSSWLRGHLSLPSWLSSPSAAAYPVVLWSKRDISWFVERQLYGSDVIGEAGAPMLSGLGMEPRDPSLAVGGQRFHAAIAASLSRWSREAEIVILSDERSVRDAVWQALAPALMGIRCRYSVPDSPEATHAALERATYPLVLVAPTLDSWKGPADGLEVLQPFLDKCDPFLLLPDVPSAIRHTWPESRQVRLAEAPLARAFSAHRGVIPDKRQTLRYADGRSTMERLRLELEELNHEVARGAVNSHCYGLFLALGERTPIRFDNPDFGTNGRIGRTPRSTV